MNLFVVMPQKKPAFYPVLFGVPLLLAVVTFLLSLYFAEIDEGIRQEIHPPQQPVSRPPERLHRLDSMGSSSAVQVPEVSVAPAVSISESSQQSPESEPQTLKEPPFYKPSNEDLAKLSQEQLVIYHGIMEDYLKFYAEWSQNSPNDVEAWNRKVEECNQQIRLMLGLEAANIINFR
jgi:hypothetical protein